MSIIAVTACLRRGIRAHAYRRGSAQVDITMKLNLRVRVLKRGPGRDGRARGDAT
jgi:hypothetical protein